MTYKSYWHSTILFKLEEYRRLQMNVTITQLRFLSFLFFYIKTWILFSSTDTGICVEDVVQTLIDLHLAHTGNSINDLNLKQSEIRNRRRHDNNNNNLDPSSILVINTDILRTALNRLSTGNLSSKNNQNLFDPAYLRLNTRR